MRFGPNALMVTSLQKYQSTKEYSFCQSYYKNCSEFVVLSIISCRVGEQHSFILRPTSPAWKPSTPYGGKYNSSDSNAGHEMQLSNGSSFGRNKTQKDLPSSLPEGGQYAVIVSCHCSHTGT